MSTLVPACACRNGHPHMHLPPPANTHVCAYRGEIQPIVDRWARWCRIVVLREELNSWSQPSDPPAGCLESFQTAICSGCGLSGLRDATWEDIHVLISRTQEHDLVGKRSLFSYNEVKELHLKCTSVVCIIQRNTQREEGENMEPHSLQPCITCSHQQQEEVGKPLSPKT